MLEEGEVKGDVVPYKTWSVHKARYPRCTWARRIPEETKQLRHNVGEAGLVRQQAVGNARKVCNLLRHAAVRIEQGSELILEFAIADAQGGDLNDALILWLQPRGFDVDDNAVLEGLQQV